MCLCCARVANSWLTILLKWAVTLLYIFPGLWNSKSTNGKAHVLNNTSDRGLQLCCAVLLLRCGNDGNWWQFFFTYSLDAHVCARVFLLETPFTWAFSWVYALACQHECVEKQINDKRINKHEMCASGAYFSKYTHRMRDSVSACVRMRSLFCAKVWRAVDNPDLDR